MEIVKFETQTWQEIPDQDNPAMFSLGLEGDKHSQECIMIFKGKYERVSDGGFVVAYCPERSDIIKKGVFWNLEDAEIFADALNLFLTTNPTTQKKEK